MAIISVEEDYGRAAQYGGAAVTAPIYYRVICDTPDHTIADIIAAVGLPAAYSTHPSLPIATAEHISVTQLRDEDSGGRVWEVRIDYASGRPYVSSSGTGGITGLSGGQTTPGQRDPNPLNRSVRVKVGWEYLEYTPFMSYPDTITNPNELQGDYIQNSRGDPFEPGLTRREQIFVVTLSKNVPSIVYRDLADFNDTVNSDVYLGFQPGEVWVSFEDMEERQESNVRFWPLTAKFRCRPVFTIRSRENTLVELGGWWDRVLDAGYYHDVGPTRIKTPFAPFGATDIKPQKLDGDGRALPAGAPAVFKKFLNKRVKRFADLNFF